MLLPASVMTLCGAFVRPRMSHWLPTEGRRSGFRLEVYNADAAGRQHAGRGAGYKCTTCMMYGGGGGGLAAQADVVEEDAGTTDVAIERSSSPPLDVLHRTEDFA